MKTPPKISIVIPSYNKVDFVEETLASILDQKYPKLEVIIQDGGSTDGTLEIIKRYAGKLPNIIKYESKKDKGQTDAINIGLKKASGDILTFINADDVYEINAFDEVKKSYLNNPKTLWFAGKGVVINENGTEIAKLVTLYKNLLLSLNSYFLLLTTNYMMQPSVFFTRDFFDQFGPFNGLGKAVMEYDTWLKAGKIKMPARINKNLSKFRLHNSAFSTSSYKSILNEDLAIVKKYTDNQIIIFLHKLNNLGRKMILKIK